MNIGLDHLGGVVAMGFLLLCSAFFSGTETALFSLTRKQVERLRDGGGAVEKILTLLSKNPTGLLVAILFGNIVVNILFFSISAVISRDVGLLYGEGWEAVLGILVLLVVILVGEILPKAAGISFSEKIVRVNGSVLHLWFHALGPIRRGLEYIAKYLEPAKSYDNRLTADELKMLINATQHDTTFGKQEKAIVEDIVNLPEIRLREIMVPRVHQLFQSVHVPASEALIRAAERELDLIPVYDGEEDHLVGVVKTCQIFTQTNPNPSLLELLQPIRFVPETKRADAMLREFLEEGLLLVGVVDEYGGLAGTVSLDDLLEEVVGDFDPSEKPLVEQLAETTYRLQGHLGIRDWRELFVGFLPDEMVRTMALDTVSGLVVSLLKRMPKTGDVVQVRNLRFTIEHVRSNRIESVLLDLAADSKEDLV